MFVFVLLVNIVCCFCVGYSIFRYTDTPILRDAEQEIKGNLNGYFFFAS